MTQKTNGRPGEKPLLGEKVPIAAYAACGILREIIRETPGRSIVTPWIWSARCIVRWLCVITMNCERFFSSDISVVNAGRVNFAGGALALSITQNGLGLSRNREKISAIA